MAFNRGDTGSRTISTMAFDFKTKTFSKLTDLYTDPQLYPAWPQFTPDAKLILMHRGNNQDFATWSGNQAEIYALDIATKKVAACDLLNGRSGNNISSPTASRRPCTTSRSADTTGRFSRPVASTATL